jgi:hypothetical protein
MPLHQRGIFYIFCRTVSMYKILVHLNRLSFPSFTKQGLDLPKPVKWQWQSLIPRHTQMIDQ